MKVVKNVINLLPIIAFIFFSIYLFYNDFYLSINPHDFASLIFSFILLIFVFTLKSFLWHRVLHRFQVKISFKVAFSSQFKSIMMKYIPGKIWVIIGRASIISQEGYSFAYCSFISSFMQIITVISGLLVGLFGTLYFEFLFLPSKISYMLLILLIILFLIFSREIIIPGMNVRFIPKFIRQYTGFKIPPVADILILSIIHWILMGYAFLLFFQSIVFNIGWYPIFLQPLANNIGILSAFTPGGLGVREGIMISYLSLEEFSIPEATTISITARFWFCIGELFVFIIGLLIRKNTLYHDTKIQRE